MPLRLLLITRVMSACDGGGRTAAGCGVTFSCLVLSRKRAAFASSAGGAAPAADATMADGAAAVARPAGVRPPRPFVLLPRDEAEGVGAAGIGSGAVVGGG